MEKKIHRFLVPLVPEETSFVVTHDPLVHQLISVLRMRAGERIILFCHEGPDEVVEILSVEKKKVLVQKIETLPKALSALKTLVVCIAPIRRDRFEMAIEKLTELGVYAIIPIYTHRTVRMPLKPERLQAISDEALEQCGGNRRVILHTPCTLAESFMLYPFEKCILAPQATSFSNTQLPESVMLYIGPEGGWSSEDEEAFKTIHATALSLGPRILRTETAAIVGAYSFLWSI